MPLFSDYVDVVQLVRPRLAADGYSTEVIDEVADCDALFVENTGYQRSSNQAAINSSASVYLDPNNAFVLANYDRLEGMYLIADLLGGSAAQGWYKITSVNVGQDKLLTNSIDNVECQLKKSTEIQYAS